MTFTLYNETALQAYTAANPNGLGNTTNLAVLMSGLDVPNMSAIKITFSPPGQKVTVGGLDIVGCHEKITTIPPTTTPVPTTTTTPYKCEEGTETRDYNGDNQDGFQLTPSGGATSEELNKVFNENEDDGYKPQGTGTPEEPIKVTIAVDAPRPNDGFTVSVTTTGATTVTIKGYPTDSTTTPAKEGSVSTGHIHDIYVINLSIRT